MDNELFEHIETLRNEIIELRTEQNEFRVSITKYVTTISRDIEWMRIKIDDINTKFDKCSFCRSDYEPNTIIKSIQKIKDEQNRTKWIVVGAASVLSIAITGILWVIQNKANLFT